MVFLISENVYFSKLKCPVSFSACLFKPRSDIPMPDFTCEEINNFEKVAFRGRGLRLYSCLSPSLAETRKRAMVSEAKCTDVHEIAFVFVATSSTIVEVANHAAIRSLLTPVVLGL